VRLAFYRGSGKLMDKIIRWWTGGEYSHVEVQFSDGKCFSSSFRDKGVRFKKIDLKPEKWNVVDISIENEAEVLEWCMTQLHKKYDLLGVLGYVLTPFRNTVQSKKRWYCSEICAHILRTFNREEYHSIPEKISPTMLCAWIGR
jgi:uncharacterized protein YycO